MISHPKFPAWASSTCRTSIKVFTGGHLNWPALKGCCKMLAKCWWKILNWWWTMAWQLLLRSWKRSTMFLGFFRWVQAPKSSPCPEKGWMLHTESWLPCPTTTCNGCDPPKSVDGVDHWWIPQWKPCVLCLVRPGPEVGTLMDCAKGTYAARSQRYRCLGRSCEAGTIHPRSDQRHSHPATFASQGAAGRVDMLKGCQPWSIDPLVGHWKFTLWMNQKMFDSSERLAILG